jgi:two-component system NtrC family sensor kinase
MPDPGGLPVSELPIPWWNRLSLKLGAVIALVTLLATAAFIVLGLSTQHRYLTDEVVRGAARFSDTIRASTYHSMLADQRDAAYQTMETIGHLQGIEKVRMMNKEGRITFSTDRAEVGQYVDKRAESCYACHAADQPLVRLAVPGRARYFQRDGHNVLGMVTPIYNEASCLGCHKPLEVQQVLGVVDIAISLADIDQEMVVLRRNSLLVSGLAVLLFAGAVSLLARRFVVKPVTELVDGTHRIARLELDQHMEVHRTDEIGRLASSFNDMITSLKRAREDLRHLNESLERQVEERTAALKDAQAQLIQSEKLSSLGRLAASVAHEINNPLSGILTYAKLMLRLHEEGALTPKAREACINNLRLVQRETERCSTIVRNLLDFARQRPLTLTEIDLNRAADEALSLLSHQIAIQGITLEKRFAPLPSVRADFGQIRQAVVNIALNACQAMAHGGTLTVTTVAPADAKWVQLTLADNGPGIPPDHLSKIFDPFFTTKERGTGLGLSVVYGIVERHGGKLELASEVGRGTTVTIRLPVAPQSEAAGVEGA